MAVTKLSDLIIPEVWLPYMQQRTTEKSRLIQSGIVDNDAEFNGRASGEGATVNMPFFNDLTGDDEILSESVPLTPRNIGSGKDIAVLCRRGNAWGTSVLSRYKSGADPAGAIADLVADYWVRKRQAMLLATLKGVFASTTMAAEHVRNVSIAAGNSATSANLISSDAALDALKLLGDEIDAITGMAVHSDIYYELLKQEAIEFLAPSETNVVPLRTYKGKTIIVDDTLPKEAGGTNGFVYSTYLFGPGAIAFGEGEMQDLDAVETDRDSLQGDDYLINRNQVIMHPRGVKWIGTPAADSPTNAELGTGANWSRVYAAKNVRLLCLKTNG